MSLDEEVLKTYKTWQDALKEQKEGEACVFDKDKKRYVNIKDFPQYDDPFVYKSYKAAPVVGFAIILGLLMGDGWWFPFFLGGFGLHYWYTYERIL